MCGEQKSLQRHEGERMRMWVSEHRKCAAAAQCSRARQWVVVPRQWGGGTAAANLIKIDGDQKSAQVQVPLCASVAIARAARGSSDARTPPPLVVRQVAPLHAPRVAQQRVGDGGGARAAIVHLLGDH
eukprot:3894348-Prymnesium_polylepis.1